MSAEPDTAAAKSTEPPGTTWAAEGVTTMTMVALGEVMVPPQALPTARASTATDRGKTARVEFTLPVSETETESDPRGLRATVLEAAFLLLGAPEQVETRRVKETMCEGALQRTCA
jgi:hypothetical protein